MNTHDMEAKARLTASAPDLLAALEAALEAVEYYDEREGAGCLLDQVRAAIAKATGGAPMNPEPNAFDAAFAAAGLMDRVNDGATGHTMTRVAVAACTIAELEAEAAIPEGEYDFLLDHVGLCLRDRNWPGPGVRIETAVRDVLAGMKGLV
jgi:hypothetical protein